MAEVILNPAAMTILLRSPQGLVGKDLVKKAIKVEAAAKRLCPVKTGRLRSSIRWTLGADGGGLFARVGTDVTYALFVHEGHKSFTVQAQNAQALRFVVDGQEVFVARGATVTIPAKKGKPFLKDALAAILK